MPDRGKVIALVDDMFFASKIAGAASHAGRSLVRVKTREELERELGDRPDLFLIDLNSSRLDPIETISFLKTRPETEAATIIGFLSHVQVDLLKQAEAAGCDYVMPRSSFSKSLGQILTGELSSYGSDLRPASAADHDAGDH